MLDFNSGREEAAVCFHRLCGDRLRAEVVGDVTEESSLVTSRTRGTQCAETSFPAPCGSRFEGQNT